MTKEWLDYYFSVMRKELEDKADFEQGLDEVGKLVLARKIIDEKTTHIVMELTMSNTGG